MRTSSNVPRTAVVRRHLQPRSGRKPLAFRALANAAIAFRRAGLSGLVDRGRYAVDALCFRFGVFPLRLRVGDIVLRGFLRDRSFLELVATDYEPFTRELLLGALDPADTIVDGGAHIGLYTILAARAQPEARIWAFEPDPLNLRALLANIARNRVTNATTIPRALTDRSGSAILYRNRGGRGNSLIARTDVGPTRPIEVATTTLDHELAGPLLHPDDGPHRLVVKLDVEGAELAALRGMREVLSKSRDAVMILEVNPGALRDTGASPELLVETIQRLGFQPMAIDEKGHRLRALTPALLARKGNLFCRRSAT